ncbi:MAG: imidazoleglycerol-phosphate dehydratase, partial [bacterium]
MKKRIAKFARRTKETSIEISLNLDGQGNSKIRTGIPFMDHMLGSLAKHGLYDLNIKAKGDLKVDPHHLVEDLGISL